MSPILGDRCGDSYSPSAVQAVRDHRSTARTVERITDKAGLEDVTYHTLRHAFASLLIVG
jgi:site-specific recombinase XerD